MTIALNHTIVYVKDRWRASEELAETLGLPQPEAFGPFVVLPLQNGASLDFMESTDAVASQHYAFLVDEVAFDEIFERLRADGRTWWADPFRGRPHEINHNDGGRGLYWEGPDGHWMEIITRPYGGA